MEEFRFLTPAELADVTKALVEAGLSSLSAQDALLKSVSVAYVALLPVEPVPLARLRSHLELMNAVRKLRNDDVPLAQYLAAAVNAASPLPAAAVLAIALAKVVAISNGISRPASDGQS